MRSQLYVPEINRAYLKSEISFFVRMYFEKFLPVFEDIEREANKRANEFYDNFMNQPASDDSIDPGSIAEKALEIGIEHYSYLKLGKYSLTATWHAILYQLWEQQLRLFLFREMSHDCKLDFKIFCTKIESIKETFQFHNVNIEDFPCWTQIDELRLLCNVIKHGDGRSASDLRKINPSLFKQEDSTDFMDLYKTTLLEETLNINEQTLLAYKNTLLSFWDIIPERNYSND